MTIGVDGPNTHGHIILDYDSETDIYEYTFIDRVPPYRKWPTKSEFINQLPDKQINHQDRSSFEGWHADVIGHIDL